MSEIEAGGKPRVLCVDDEPRLLESLARHLRNHFAVATAQGGAAALELLQRRGPFALVVSDMRMPGMDGATFLGHVRRQAPDTVRILLTGFADVDAAIAAVNEANIFRFLTKPCPPEVLLKALTAAAEQHRLVTAERVLLEQTLHGSIKALTDILSLVNPTAFGRATRVKQHVSKLAERLGIASRWALEVAAMLSQIGCVTLPPSVTEKVYHNRALDFEERRMVGRLPMIAEQLVANIPRLEAVREILLYQDKHFDGTGHPLNGKGGEQIPVGARLLKVVLDFDGLQDRDGAAFDVLRERPGWYDLEVLRAFEQIVRGNALDAEGREMSLRDVRPGMIIAEDVTTRTGMVLIARGQEVTPALVERIRNFSETIGVNELVRVVSAPAKPPSKPLGADKPFHAFPYDTAGR